MIETAPRSEFDVAVTPATIRRTQQLLVHAAMQAVDSTTQVPRTPGASELEDIDREQPLYKVVEAPIGRMGKNIGARTANLIANVRLPESIQAINPNLARDAERFTRMSPVVRERLAMAALFGYGDQVPSIEDRTRGGGAATIEVRDGVYVSFRPGALEWHQRHQQIARARDRQIPPTVHIPNAVRNSPAALSAPAAPPAPVRPRSVPPQWPVPAEDPNQEFRDYNPHGRPQRMPKAHQQDQILPFAQQVQEAIAVALQEKEGEWLRAKSMGKLTKQVMRLLLEFSSMDELHSVNPNARRLNANSTIEDLHVEVEGRWWFQRKRAMRRVVRAALEQSRYRGAPVLLLRSTKHRRHAGVATPRAVETQKEILKNRPNRGSHRR